MARRRTAIILGPVTQFMFFIMAGRLRPELELFYLLLFVLVSIADLFHWMATGEKVIDFEQFDLRTKGHRVNPRLWKGVLGGIAFGAVPLALIALGGRGRPVPDFWNEVVTQGLFVGFVETWYLISTVRTVLYGRWVWVLGAFPFAHEYVRDALVAADWGGFATSYAYTAGFGYFFLWLYAMGSRKMHGREEWFGAINSWVAHIVVNLGILALEFLLLGFPVHPV